MLAPYLLAAVGEHVAPDEVAALMMLEAQPVMAAAIITQPHILRACAASDDEYMRRQVAGNPAVPSELYVTLIRDRASVRAYLAGNKNAPVAYLFDCVTRTRRYRQRLAQNKALPEAVARLLKNDVNEQVRQRLARNESCPADVLEHLARHGGMEADVASNESSAIATIEWIARDAIVGDHGDWLLSCAKNKNMPVELLEEIYHSCDGDMVIQSGLATNPSLPDDIFRMLSEHGSQHSQARTVSSGRLTPEQLAVKAQEGSWAVRRAVAVNPQTPPAVLNILAHDPDHGVAEAVYENPGAPAALLENAPRDNEGLCDNPATSLAKLASLPYGNMVMSQRLGELVAWCAPEGSSRDEASAMCSLARNWDEGTQNLIEAAVAACA